MLGAMKCPTNLENYCASGSGTRNSFLSSAGNHPLRCSARSRASLLRGSRLCAFQSISRLTPCDALRGCTSLLRLGSVTKACPFRTPFDHPSTLRASTSASAPGSGAHALSYWLRPRAGYRRLRRPSTRLRASGGVMLSLRRQVPPGLCHRATPSPPRTLPSSLALLRYDHVATTLPISRPSGLFPSDFHACSVCVGSDHQGLDSAKLRRLRRGGHRPHATPRLASRLPAAPAAAQRVLARPTRDTERTARLGSRLYVVSGCGAQRPRRTTPATNNAHDGNQYQDHGPRHHLGNAGGERVDVTSQVHPGGMGWRFDKSVHGSK